MINDCNRHQFMGKETEHFFDLTQAPCRSFELTSVQPLPVAPSVPFPTSTALQPVINLPTASSRRRFSSYLHPDRQILPPFKPGPNLYRKVLNRQFLRVTKKVLTTNDSDLTQTTRQDPFFASLLPLSKTAASLLPPMTVEFYSSLLPF
jgi:hypothetical protein